MVISDSDVFVFYYVKLRSFQWKALSLSLYKFRPCAPLQLRNLIEQVASYCEKFPSVLVRPSLLPGWCHDCTKGLARFFLVQLPNDWDEVGWFFSAGKKRYLNYIPNIPRMVSLHVRQWKYNSKVSEFFVETETTTRIKQKEMERVRASSTHVSWPYCVYTCEGVTIVGIGRCFQPSDFNTYSQQSNHMNVFLASCLS